MKTIVILALEGVLDSSLTITLDALRTAELFRARNAKTGGAQVFVASHRRTLTTGGGLKLAADLTFDELRARHPTRRAEWLLVPGLGITTAAALASRLAAKDARVAIGVLQSTRARNIGASCSSVFLLAEAGLLAGHQVTTTWWLAQTFRARHAEVRLDEGRMVVRDGRFVTAGSAFAQLALVLAVITDVFGASIAHLCSRYLLIDHRPSQARYMIPSHVRQVDPTVVAAERWIDAHLAEAVNVTDLAAALAMSPKTLARRIAAATGLSPVKFLQRRRVMQAAQLIETTPLTIEAVAEKIGYQDATTLRKLIKRELGVTPAALRP